MNSSLSLPIRRERLSNRIVLAFLAKSTLLPWESRTHQAWDNKWKREKGEESRRMLREKRNFWTPVLHVFPSRQLLPSSLNWWHTPCNFVRAEGKLRNCGISWQDLGTCCCHTAVHFKKKGEKMSKDISKLLLESGFAPSVTQHVRSECHCPQRSLGTKLHILWGNRQNNNS